MALATAMPFVKSQWLDGNGTPYAGAKLFTYVSGTTTKQATYTDATGATPNTNPVVLDSAGRANVFLTPGLTYKFVLAPSTDTDPPTSPYWTEDGIQATPGAGGTVTVTALAGGTISAGDCCYESDGSGGLTAGRWYRCDSGTDYKSTAAAQIGFAGSSGVAGDSIEFTCTGLVSGLTSLSAGTVYYVGTAGAITSSAPTLARRLGVATSATELLVTQFAGSVHATSTGAGLVSATTQTIGGAKTLTSALTVQAPITMRPGTASSGSVIAEGNGFVWASSGTANTGAAANTVATFTIPANTFVAGSRGRFRFAGTVANTAGAKTATIDIGGFAYAPALVVSSATAWVIDLEILYVSSTVLVVNGFELQGNIAATSVRNVVAQAAALGPVPTDAITVNFQITGAVNGDITAYSASVSL